MFRIYITLHLGINHI